MEDTSNEVSRLLRRLSTGDKAAGDELVAHVYPELHKLAAAYLRRERHAHTWQTTDLVNAAYLKLVAEPEPDFRGRSHFFGIAAQIMRRLLTDYARMRKAKKRGSNPVLVSLEDCLAIADEDCGLIAELDEALKRLEAFHPRAAKVVEMRFFGGLTDVEIAELLEVSTKTVSRSWTFARAWLFGELSRTEGQAEQQ